MKLLHVFAGPFPTVQGTQALVGEICRLLSEAGHQVHLLCYAHGGWNAPEPFHIHRIADRPRFHSERSAPSVRKIALDMALARECAQLIKELNPDVVHAHHYEALLAAKAAMVVDRRPLAFHLHALFGLELSTYFPKRITCPVDYLGTLADRLLPRLADGVGAINPFIETYLQGVGVPRDKIVLVRPSIGKLPAARPRIADTNVVKAVYLGNLDPYQELDNLLEGLGHVTESVRRGLVVEVITDSDSSTLEKELTGRGWVDFVKVIPHGSPEQALNRLGWADMMIIPRSTPGGVPIKLVNALAMGIPVLVDFRLDPGLAHGIDAWTVNMGSPRQLGDAISILAADEKLRSRLCTGAKNASRRLFSPRAALENLERLYATVHQGDAVRV